MKKATPKQIRKLHAELCEELGIPPCKITVRHGGHRTSGWFIHSPALVYVNPQGADPAHPWKKRSWRWICAHETYHWFQSYSGHLSVRLYKGKRKSFYKKRGKWATWPWEKAANLYANKVTRKL